MNQRYYLDACIWRDYLENRSDRFRPLGDWATQLINKILRQKDIFVMTALLKEELLKYCKESEVKNMFEIIPIKQFLFSSINEKQTKEAISFARERMTPLKDTLHAIIARDIGAIFVTRDAHFQELQEIVEIKKPEDLI